MLKTQSTLSLDGRCDDVAHLPESNVVAVGVVRVVVEHGLQKHSLVFLFVLVSLFILLRSVTLFRNLTLVSLFAMLRLLPLLLLHLILLSRLVFLVSHVSIQIVQIQPSLILINFFLLSLLRSGRIDWKIEILDH